MAPTYQHCLLLWLLLCLQSCTPDVSQLLAHQVREMGASGVQFIDVPEGFWSAALVPYSRGAERPALDRVAEIQHLSNRYCARNMVTEHSPTETDITLLSCTLDFDEYIVV